jgi:ATP synthase protein I
MKEAISRGLLRFFLMQWTIVLLMSILFGWLKGGVAAFSSFIGGVACVVPHTVLALKTFKHRGALNAKKIVRAFYGGEAIKFLLSIVIFTAVFKLFSAAPAVFFISFIVLQTSSWLAPLMIKTK